MVLTCEGQGSGHLGTPVCLGQLHYCACGGHEGDLFRCIKEGRLQLLSGVDSKLGDIPVVCNLAFP